MNLFKFILVIFAAHFIRRFWQFYKIVEKRGRELSAAEEKQEASKQTVEAEYKVID